MIRTKVVRICNTASTGYLPKVFNDVNSTFLFLSPAGRHSDDFWYRARVSKCIDENNVAVRFVDYGDLTMMNVADLQPLWPQFRQLPYQVNHST